MKKSRFTEEQIVQILRDADHESVPMAAKRNGVSEQTIYTWCKRYGKMNVADVRYMNEIEAENAQLRRTLADLKLEAKVLKEIINKEW